MADWDFGRLDHIEPEEGSEWGDLEDHMFSEDEYASTRRYADYGAGPEPHYSPEHSSPPAQQGSSFQYVNGLGNTTVLPATASALRHDPISHSEQHHTPGTSLNQNRQHPRTHFRPWEQQPLPTAAALEPPQRIPTPDPAQQAPARSYRERVREYVESLDSETDEDMPATTRQRRNRNGGSLVDFTDSPASSSTSRQPRTRKRRADSIGDEGAANKRKKPISTETVNLSDEEDEAPSADAELLKAQQLEALKAQQGRDDGPVKIGKRTCIICLENYTNATTSACGHIFCHECLTRALMASEKNSDRGTGNCPACRKPINRKKANTLIPINFMKRSAFAQKGRKPGVAI